MSVYGKIMEDLRIRRAQYKKGLRDAEGKTVPADETAGYSPGGFFRIIDGDDIGKVYINKGTYESCAFKEITTSA